MNMKKMLPVVLLVLMALVTLGIKRCNNEPSVTERQVERRNTNNQDRNKPVASRENFDRTGTKLFFTKHAKCRMKCRHISQQEVKDILVNGTINYNKSDLQDARGPTYAVEGITSDRQHVRIIFAPKQQHVTVVTVIDLDVEYACNCN